MERINRGLNQESIQEINRSLIINLLRKEGICARTHLSKLSNLKQATVTNIINDFIEWNLVKEVGFLPGSKGRRSIGISINNDEFRVLAVRIARKNYSVSIFDLSGNSCCSIKKDLIPGQKPEDVLEHILKDAEYLINDTKNQKILAIGIALPGPYSTKHERITLMTEATGWNKISIKECVYDRLKIPVFIEQDANAGALAQYWYNEENYINNSLVYIAVGQGVGAGIIINGQVLRGNIGIAGEIGHTTIDYNGEPCECGNVGCLEKYCSSIALTKRINLRLNPEQPYTFSEVCKLIKEGNAIAVEEFELCCNALAMGIVNVVNNFNPSIIVIGDEMAHILPEKMLSLVKALIKNRVLPEVFNNMKITMSLIKNDSMLHGAATVAINDIFQNTNQYLSKGGNKYTN